MSHPHRKKIALIAGGIAVSIVLTVAVDSLTEGPTPGWFVVDRLGGVTSPEVDVVRLLSVVMGVDFLFCFAVLLCAYLLFAKLRPMIRANRMTKH